MTQPTKQQTQNAINALQARLYYTAICANYVGSVEQGTNSSTLDIYNKLNDMVNSCSDNSSFVPFQSSSWLPNYASNVDNMNKTLMDFDVVSQEEGFIPDGFKAWAFGAFFSVNNFYTFLEEVIKELTEACKTAPDA